MKKYKILNLYACLGGNRYKWDEVAKEAGVKIEVTAVELDHGLANLYQERFTNDLVLRYDAHEFLLNHYKDFDFIWSSPPCPTHSRANFWASKSKDNRKKYYPDMKLYEEIVFLDNWYNGLYVVENVIGYYKPLIEPQKRGRHYYWSNFKLPQNLGDRGFKLTQTKNEVQELCKFHEIDLNRYKGTQRKDKIARNLVDYEAGKTILDAAMNIIKKSSTEQIALFEH